MMDADKILKETKKTGKLVIWSFIILIMSIISMVVYPDLGFPLMGVAVIFFLAGLVKSKELGQSKLDLAEKNLNHLHSSVKNYTPTQTVYLENYTSLLSIDENNKKICIIKNNKVEILNFSDILQSELIEDGVSVTKVSRGNQVVGMMAGGILAGGIGAIVGGLSASTKTRQEVNKIKLQVIINNTSNPIREIIFLNKPYPIKKDKPIYKDAFEEANHWYKVMHVIIEQIYKGMI